MTAFDRLFSSKDQPERLKREYSTELAAMLTKPFCSLGPAAEQRVKWKDGRRARVEDVEGFRSPGLYIWGAADRVLYIGLTVGRTRPGSFGKRFNRYLWSKEMSQCGLASDYESALIENGIDGFPEHVRAKYRTGHR